MLTTTFTINSATANMIPPNDIGQAWSNAAIFTLPFVLRNLPCHFLK